MLDADVKSAFALSDKLNALSVNCVAASQLSEVNWLA